jgi:spermidine/putrescine transport system substrate-binding protein
MQPKRFLVLFLIGVLSAACASAWQPTPTPPAPEPLVVASWAGYMPQGILDAFTQATGIPVEFAAYSDQDEVMEWLRAGERFDVVVLGDSYIPAAVDAGLLAELDFENIPNFRNLGPNFRDLAFDPENRYSIMIQWGTTGLVVRTDRLVQPVTSWADLWNPDYAGKIGVWPYREELIGIALKSLGYPLNTEDPAELRAAGERLIELRQRVYLLDPDQPTGTANLLDDHTVMIYGWSYDGVEAHKLLSACEYVLPQEGTMLWTDNVTIPANSRQKRAAEQFINFLLRPEISAMMVNELWLPSPNEAARQFIKPEILYNPVIYPSMQTLEHAEFSTAVSEETRKQYEEIWERFLAAGEPTAHQ